MAISLVILPPYEYFGEITKEHNIADTANTSITEMWKRSIIGYKVSNLQLTQRHYYVVKTMVSPNVRISLSIIELSQYIYDTLFYVFRC